MRQREAAVAKAKINEGKRERGLQKEAMFQSFEVLDQTTKAIQNLSLPERVKSSEIQNLVKKIIKGATTEGFKN